MNNETQPIEESLFLNQNIKYILSILNDDIKSSSWLLSNGVHKIGRLEDKEIILEDITVSKNHAYISVEDDELEIYDEGSTNGIFVNGNRIFHLSMCHSMKIMKAMVKVICEVCNE